MGFRTAALKEQAVRVVRRCNTAELQILARMVQRQLDVRQEQGQSRIISKIDQHL